MARIRSIKPEFFTDEDVADLQPLHRLLFIGLWCHADKAGRLKDKPRTIKAQCMPYDKVNIDEALDALVTAGFIMRYESDGQSVIQIRTWEEHQRPHHTEKDSTLPPFKNGSLTVKQPCQDGARTECMNHAPSFPFPSHNKKQETDKEEPSLPEGLAGSSVFVAAWEDWKRHRKEIRKPLTKTSVEKQLKQFEEWGPERSVAAIEHTISKGWQGIREDETPTRPRGRGSPQSGPSREELLAQVLGNGDES